MRGVDVSEAGIISSAVPARPTAAHPPFFAAEVEGVTSPPVVDGVVGVADTLFAIGLNPPPPPPNVDHPPPPPAAFLATVGPGLAVGVSAPADAAVFVALALPVKLATSTLTPAAPMSFAISFASRLRSFSRRRSISPELCARSLSASLVATARARWWWSYELVCSSY